MAHVDLVLGALARIQESPCEHRRLCRHATRGACRSRCDTRTRDAEIPPDSAFVVRAPARQAPPRSERVLESALRTAAERIGR